MRLNQINNFQKINIQALACKRPSFKGIIEDVYMANQDNKKEQDAFFRSEVYAEHRGEIKGPFICHDGMSYNAKLDEKISNVRERLNKLNISEDDFEDLFKIFMEDKQINKEIEKNPVMYYRTNGIKLIEFFVDFLEKIKEMTVKN